MFETIVWATDGSELADRALEQVKELARLHHSKIVAVHGNELTELISGRAPALTDEPELHAKIARQVEELVGEGFDAELRVESGPGDVSDLVATAARDIGADAIVVGTHGHGGFKAAVLGSVTLGLLHSAGCPILVIPPARVRDPEAVATR